MTANESEVRGVVDTVEREIVKLAAERSDATAALVRSWANLVSCLALAPAPDLRVCPSCGHTGRRDAKICGYCWTALEALA